MASYGNLFSETDKKRAYKNKNKEKFLHFFMKLQTNNHSKNI